MGSRGHLLAPPLLLWDDDDRFLVPVERGSSPINLYN